MVRRETGDGRYRHRGSRGTGRVGEGSGHGAKEATTRAETGGAPGRGVAPGGVHLGS